MVDGKGYRSYDWEASITQACAQGVTDEFLQTTILTNETGERLFRIQAGHGVLCCNFRTDRNQQIMQMLTQNTEHGSSTHPRSLCYLILTSHHEISPGGHSLFDRVILKNTLGEVLGSAGETTT